MSGIAEAVEATLGRIADATCAAGRKPDAVTLIAVTKTVDAARICEAFDAGLARIGENRVQEADAKRPETPDGLEWHLIGHLQRNKTRRAVELFDWIQSVDSVSLLRRLDRIAGELGRAPNALIQVNTSREDSKSGVAPESLAELLDAAEEATAVNVCGLMTIGPTGGSRAEIQRAFAELRELSETATFSRPLKHLSMGMTNDFELAIAEGATMVRIGSAIFGARA